MSQISVMKIAVVLVALALAHLGGNRRTSLSEPARNRLTAIVGAVVGGSAAAVSEDGVDVLTLVITSPVLFVLFFLIPSAFRWRGDARS